MTVPSGPRYSIAAAESHLIFDFTPSKLTILFASLYAWTMAALESPHLLKIPR